MDALKLDFAYRYPFSHEAKEIVANLNVTSLNSQYLQEGVSQLSSALKEGRIRHERAKGITEVKLRYIMGYVYARMLVSALGDDYSISRFAEAEADASSEFLALNIDDLVKIGNEFGLGVRREKDDFVMSFEKFVAIPKKDSAMLLINQRMSNGNVRLDVRRLLPLVKGAIEKEISRGLPIEKSALPKEIVEASKSLKPQERKASLPRSGSYSWIEKLMENPISDVRHRSVNLIFAPYLVNVKGIEEGSAVKLIVDYIERCKKINPNTKINESYIKYQCKYAKSKGLRPLSLAKAKELLKEVAEFG